MACNCKSSLHVANAAVAEVPSGGNVPLGTTVRQSGCACRLNGDGIVLACGTYTVLGAVTLAPVAAATADSAQAVSLDLMAGGSKVQGGSASADAAGTVTLPLATTVTAPAQGTTLTLLNSGAAVSVTGVSLMVIR